MKKANNPMPEGMKRPPPPSAPPRKRCAGTVCKNAGNYCLKLNKIRDDKL